MLLSAGVAILVIALCERALLHQTLVVARGLVRELLKEPEVVEAAT